MFVAKNSNPLKITASKWHKTYFEKEFTANTNGVKDDSYIKFKIEEGLAGIKSFDINLKDSKGTTVNLNDVITIKYSETDNIDNAIKLTPTKDGNFYNNTNTYDENNFLSGWYYITTELMISALEEGNTYKLNIKIKNGFDNVKEIESQIVINYSIPHLKGGETNDKAAPGPVVEQYTFADGNNIENVFPRVGNPGLTGHDFKDSPSIPNGDGNEVRWFYTNSWNSKNEWGIFLKQEFAKSNISENTPAIILYQKNSDETLTDTELAQITKETVIDNPTKTFTLTSTDAFTNYFGIGTHSFVVMNDAGVVTPAYTFVVVKDDKGPVMTTSNENNPSEHRDLKFLITYDFPNFISSSTDPKEIWYRNPTTPDKTNEYPTFDWYGTSNHSVTKMDARKYTFNCNSINDCLQNKFIIRLSGSYDKTDNNKNKNIYEQNSKPTYHNEKEYWSEAWPSRESSGISQYYVCRVFNSWRSPSNYSDPFIPAFPPETNTSTRFMDDIIHIIGTNKTYNYNSSRKNGTTGANKSIKYDPNYSSKKGYFDNWKTYTVGTDIEIIPFVKDCFEPVTISGDYPNKYWMAPITLCFKDNCGNIDYMLLTVPDWYDYSAFAYRFQCKEH